jgi:type IV secretion system protein VirB9
MKHLILLMIGLAAAAQTQPAPNDNRVATVSYAGQGPIKIDTTSGAVVSVMFPPDERIEKVIVGDAGAYQVTIPSLADAVFVRSLRSSASSTMTVLTAVHSYEFILNAANSGPTPYVIQVRNSEPTKASTATSAPQPTAAGPGRYKVTGSAAVRPSAMNDDGLRTYIRWPPSQPIPAIFGISANGQEEMVNGYMRGDAFTIDRVFSRLIFRIDDAKASATRLKEKEDR